MSIIIVLCKFFLLLYIIYFIIRIVDYPIKYPNCVSLIIPSTFEDYTRCLTNKTK